MPAEWSLSSTCKGKGDGLMCSCYRAVEVLEPSISGKTLLGNEDFV